MSFSASLDGPLPLSNRGIAVGQTRTAQSRIRLAFLVVATRLSEADRATILGALLWMAEKLKSEDGERASALWAEKGKEAFGLEVS